MQPRPTRGRPRRRDDARARAATDPGRPQARRDTGGARHEDCIAEAIIVDRHDDIPLVILASNYDLGTKSTRTHTDLARMKAGGITGEFFSIYVEGSSQTSPRHVAAVPCGARSISST